MFSVNGLLDIQIREYSIFTQPEREGEQARQPAISTTGGFCNLRRLPFARDMFLCSYYGVLI